MNKITEETIDYISILAKLELSGQEKEEARKDMAKMLNYIELLNELDTEDATPMSHAFAVNNVFREDKVENDDQRDQILANAPASKNGMFKVPKTVE